MWEAPRPNCNSIWNCSRKRKTCLRWDNRLEAPKAWFKCNLQLLTPQINRGCKFTNSVGCRGSQTISNHNTTVVVATMWMTKRKVASTIIMIIVAKWWMGVVQFAAYPTLQCIRLFTGLSNASRSKNSWRATKSWPNTWETQELWPSSYPGIWNSSVQLSHNSKSSWETQAELPLRDLIEWHQHQTSSLYASSPVSFSMEASLKWEVKDREIADQLLEWQPSRLRFPDWGMHLTLSGRRHQPTLMMLVRLSI